MRCRSRMFVALLACAIFFAACRKDILHWGEATRIEGLPSVRWNRIATADNGLVVIAGGEKFDRADLLLSRDGGSTWEHRSFPEIGKGLYGLSVTPDGRVLGCGFRGVALVSDANAEAFRTEDLPDERYFVACALLSNARRILLSTVTFETSTILTRDDAGGTLYNEHFKFGLSDVAFVDAQTGYASGYGVILRTTNGGETWGYTAAAGDHFVSLDVHAADTAYACGNTGSILRTTDGGEHWQKLRTAARYSQPFYALQDVLFTDAQHGYAVGENGLVIFTDDAGEHWSEFERFTNEHLRSIARLPSGHLLVCGNGGALWRLTPR